jgi:hypothetical protein
VTPIHQPRQTKLLDNYRLPATAPLIDLLLPAAPKDAFRNNQAGRYRLLPSRTIIIWIKLTYTCFDDNLGGSVAIPCVLDTGFDGNLLISASNLQAFGINLDSNNISYSVTQLKRSSAGSVKAHRLLDFNVWGYPQYTGPVAAVGGVVDAPNVEPVLLDNEMPVEVDFGNESDWRPPLIGMDALTTFWCNFNIIYPRGVIDGKCDLSVVALHDRLVAAIE